MAPPRSRYRWNPRAQRYIRISDGQFVGRAELRAAIDRAIARGGSRITALTQRMLSGRLSLAQWELAMRAELKSMHLMNAAAAKGGWAQMTAADFGRVGAELQKQYAYLARFAAELYTGEQRPTRRALLRAEMYAEIARRTYEETQRAGMRDAGYVYEKNLLGAADHCAGCIEQTTLGWVLIGTLTAIGDRTCLARCHCRLIYARALPAEQD